MTFEEMERTMQFILEQQAQLTVKHAQADERMSRHEEAQRGLLQTQQAMQETIRQTQENSARQIEHLGNALVELTESHTRTQESLRELAEAQAHGERRLDALIDIVRRDREAGQEPPT